MAADPWPPSLPDRFRRQGFAMGVGDARLRSEMDTGPAKVRRRSSAMPSRMSGVIPLRSAQVAVADAFVQDTLQNGSLAFRFLHPFTRVPMLVRFVDLPSSSSVGGDWYDYAMSLEILP